MNQDLFTQFHREYKLLRRDKETMNREQFTKYQRELNSRRENELKSSPKLSPKVILSDDLFDVSINDIPMNIKPPVLPVQKEQTNKTSKELW